MLTVLVPGTTAARTAAAWIEDLWGELPVVAYLNAHGKTGSESVLPLVLGRIGTTGELEGTVSLLESDLAERPDLSPWVGCLIVRPDLRRRGLGGDLLAAIEEKATGYGFDDLHLFAVPALRPYYSEHGWVYVETTTKGEKAVVVMQRSVAESGSPGAPRTPRWAVVDDVGSPA